MAYKSLAQAAYFNIHRKQLEKQGVNVDEWNRLSKGKKIPKRVKSKYQGGGPTFGMLSPQDLARLNQNRSDATRVQGIDNTPTIVKQQNAQAAATNLAAQRLADVNEIARRKQAISTSNVNPWDFSKSAVGDKMRLFPNDPHSVIDELNPAVWVGQMADDLGHTWSNPNSSAWDKVRSVGVPIAFGLANNLFRGNSNSKGPISTQEITRGPIDWGNGVDYKANPGFDPRAYENTVKNPYVEPTNDPALKTFIKNTTKYPSNEEQQIQKLIDLGTYGKQKLLGNSNFFSPKDIEILNLDKNINTKFDFTPRSNNNEYFSNLSEEAKKNGISPDEMLQFTFKSLKNRISDNQRGIGSYNQHVIDPNVLQKGQRSILGESENLLQSIDRPNKTVTPFGDNPIWSEAERKRVDMYTEFLDNMKRTKPEMYQKYVNTSIKNNTNSFNSHIGESYTGKEAFKTLSPFKQGGIMKNKYRGQPCMSCGGNLPKAQQGRYIAPAVAPISYYGNNAPWKGHTIYDNSQINTMGNDATTQAAKDAYHKSVAAQPNIDNLFTHGEQNPFDWGNALEWGTAIGSQLSGMYNNNNQNQYMYNQYSTMGQQNSAPAANYQPNPYSIYAKYGGSIKRYLKGIGSHHVEPTPDDVDMGLDVFKRGGRPTQHTAPSVSQASQQGGNQAMQIIQAYAQIVQQDPRAILQKFNSLPAAQKQQALQQMAQTVQQAQQQQQQGQQQAQGQQQEAPQQEQQEPQQEPQQQEMQEQQQGGQPQPQQGQNRLQKIMMVIVQELQAGKKPQQILKELVHSGVPQQQATKIIQAVMQHMQQQQGQQQPQQGMQPQGQMMQQPQGQSPMPPQQIQQGQPMQQYGGFPRKMKNNVINYYGQPIQQYDPMSSLTNMMYNPSEQGAQFNELMQNYIKEGGVYYRKGGWVQKATKGMRTDHPCTGSKFGGSSCRPGTKRYALAKTFRKMAKS